MTADLRAHLDRLDTALAEATPGPWEHITDDHGRKGIEHSIWSGEEGGLDGSYVSEQVEDPADAALIVAAVNALPALTAAVRAAADLADELDGHVMPRSFHPAGTHSDGASSAYADAAVRLRAALSAALPEGESE